jgi:hypothetical protein
MYFLNHCPVSIVLSATPKNKPCGLFVNSYSRTNCDDFSSCVIRTVKDPKSADPKTPQAFQFPFEWFTAARVVEDICQSATHLMLQMGMHLPDKIPNSARGLEGSRRHVGPLVSKEFVDRVPFFRARQSPNTVANFLKEVTISQYLDGLVPTVVFLFAHDDRNGLAVTCDGDRFIPALDYINEFAELRLDF